MTWRRRSSLSLRLKIKGGIWGVLKELLVWIHGLEIENVINKTEGRVFDFHQVETSFSLTKWEILKHRIIIYAFVYWLLYPLIQMCLNPWSSDVRKSSKSQVEPFQIFYFWNLKSYERRLLQIVFFPILSYLDTGPFKFVSFM